MYCVSICFISSVLLQMSIAERLGEMDLSSLSADKGALKVTASLQTDNFAVLLVQGLESSDANILNVCILFACGF